MGSMLSPILDITLKSMQPRSVLVVHSCKQKPRSHWLTLALLSTCKPLDPCWACLSFSERERGSELVSHCPQVSRGFPQLCSSWGWETELMEGIEDCSLLGRKSWHFRVNSVWAQAKQAHFATHLRFYQTLAWRLKISFILDSLPCLLFSSEHEKASKGYPGDGYRFCAFGPRQGPAGPHENVPTCQGFCGCALAQLSGP